MRAALALALALLPPAAHAGELLTGFDAALASDPAYSAAKAEYEANRFGAERARRAYWPEFSARAGERAEVPGFQTTYQISQPVIDADRYATRQGTEPLEARALATLRQREGDLLQRFYKAVADLVRAREQLRLNEAKTGSLEQQLQAAKRTLSLGTGTRADIYDASVRVASARAEALTLRANLSAAERAYESQTRTPAPAGAFRLARERRNLVLESLSVLMQRAEAVNPQIIGAAQTERLAELDVTRKHGAFIPRVNAIARQTRLSGGQQDSYVGLAFEFPLQSGSLLDVSAAKANLTKASEDLRAARERTRLDVQRLYEIVASGGQEPPIRLEAIEAASLGVEASEKSFRGGVRTQLDVLNSIQTLYQTHDDYVAAVLGLAGNFILLHTLVNTPSREVLGQLEAFLF